MTYGKITITISRDTEFTEDQRVALIAALEFLFDVQDAGNAGKSIDEIVGGAPFGWTMEALGLYTNVDEAEQWRKLALSRWERFRKIWMDYEIGKGYGNSRVVIDHHEHSLVKMIPFLLGRPELALPDVTAPSRSEKAFKQETLGEFPTREEGELLGLSEERLKRREQIRAQRRAEGYAQLGDPHHHEERMPAYPTESLDFGEPEAVEAPRTTLPLCGAVYQDGDFRAECTVDASWAHDEHSSGEWHWRTPGPGK